MKSSEAEPTSVRVLFTRSGLYLIGLVASKLVGVAATILLARHFTPDVFGQVVLFLTLVSLVTGIGDAGLVSWYQIEAPRRGRAEALRAVFAARVGTLLVSLVLLVSLLAWYPIFPDGLATIFVLALVSESILSLLEGYYLERREPLIAASRTAAKMTAVIFWFFWVGPDFSIGDFAGAFLLGSLVTTVALFPWSVLRGAQGARLAEIMQTLRAAAPFGVLSISSLAYTRGDSLVIRFALGSGALGYYGVAYRVLESLGVVPAVVSLNFFSMLASSGRVRRAEVWKVVGLMAALGASFGLLVYGSAGLLIRLLFGEDYTEAVVPLQIFAGVLFLHFLNAPLSALVQASKSVGRFTPFAVLNTVGNISLNLVFVPLYGIEAAAWIMLVTELTGLLLNGAFARSDLLSGRSA